MTQTEMLFGSTLGQILRDEGMAQVQDNAGEWRDLTRQRADEWIKSMPAGTIFTGEDIRLDLQDAGLEEPHHPNAWSAVIGGRIRVWLKSKISSSRLPELFLLMERVISVPRPQMP